MNAPDKLAQLLSLTREPLSSWTSVRTEAGADSAAHVRITLSATHSSAIIDTLVQSLYEMLPGKADPARAA
jgi:7-keto-8-aminopelargonate synthetase-like enzyme